MVLSGTPFLQKQRQQRQQPQQRPAHGGKIYDASKKYGIARSDWLDLSTGINPNSWPVPHIPEHVWRTLPDNDELDEAARQYYAAEHLLVTAGSQQSIEIIPKILGHKLTVGIVSPTFAEHAYAWKKQGHEVQLLTVENIELKLKQLDVLVVVNPNNPCGYRFTPDELMAFQENLASRHGFLVVDEAFMDVSPEYSVLPYSQREGLIVLRSVGKFFGLAGIRCGFAFARPEILQKIADEMSPWSVNHPARWIVSRAMTDRDWIKENIIFLQHQSAKLRHVLIEGFEKKIKVTGCSLFQTLYCEDAEKIYESLAQQGILVRLLDQKDGLRFGLPYDLYAMNKLTNAIKVDFNGSQVNG